MPTLLAEFELMPSAIPYPAWLLVLAGRSESARERLLQATLDPVEIPAANLMELMGASEAAVLLGDQEIARRIYPLLARASDRQLVNLAPGAVLGPSSRVLGDLARFIGRDADAARHYDDAIAFAEKLGSPPLLELYQKARAALCVEPPAPPAAPRPPAASAEPPSPAPSLARERPALPVLRREAELWVLEAPGGAALRLKPSKGLDYLEKLLERPGRALHVIELAGIEHFTGDAGALLDPRAKLEYRRRLDDLGEALAEAERFGDADRARSAQQEIDALAEQLAHAVGLGGRDRRAASDVERARVNVQRRLKDAIVRIAAVDPALGRYLAASVQTGTYCVFQPL
jgi:hypothetical protein